MPARKNQESPSKEESCLGREIKLGGGHHHERSEVQDCKDGQRKRVAARDGLGGRKTAEQGGRYGQHGLGRPCPAAIPDVPQRMARRHKTVIKPSLQDVASPTDGFLQY